MNDLINFGIIHGFVVLSLIIYGAVVICIIKCHNNTDNHERGSSDEHVIVAIKESSGINPSVLRSIPFVDFNSQDFKDGIECVVCLSELADGDKARVFPGCNHWFHADCIDTWFQSHSTCPICRKIVSLVQRGTRRNLVVTRVWPKINHDPSSESARFPTNPPPNTNTAVIEDYNSNETNEVRRDLTAAVVDIPAKRIENIITHVH